VFVKLARSMEFMFSELPNTNFIFYWRNVNETAMLLFKTLR